IRHVEAIFFVVPDRVAGFPWFAPSPAGLGLFVVTPAFLLAFNARRGRLEVAAALAVALTALPSLMYAWTGASQFGYRFSLDYLPMLAILTASGIRNGIGRRAWAVVGLSVFMACWGPLYFFQTRLELLLHHQWTVG